MPLIKVQLWLDSQSLKRSLSLILFCWLTGSLSAQKKVTLDGFIKDSLTGETLIGTNLTIPAISKAVFSNQYGFYSLTLSKGRYRLDRVYPQMDLA